MIYAVSIQIARRLLGKLLIDLRNTREEAISIAELKSNHDHHSSTIITDGEEAEAKSTLSLKNDDIKRSSTFSDLSMDQDDDDDDDKETQYRLDPK